MNSFNTDGGFGEEGLDGDIMGDEEGGGWDVGDEDLVLPPDLVSLFLKINPQFPLMSVIVPMFMTHLKVQTQGSVMMV